MYTYVCVYACICVANAAEGRGGRSRDTCSVLLTDRRVCAGSAGHGEEGRQRGEVERRRRRVKVGEERRPTHMTEVLLVRTGSVVTGRQWVKALFI